MERVMRILMAAASTSAFAVAILLLINSQSAFVKATNRIITSVKNEMLLEGNTGSVTNVNIVTSDEIIATIVGNLEYSVMIDSTNLVSPTDTFEEKVGVCRSIQDGEYYRSIEYEEVVENGISSIQPVRVVYRKR